MKVAIYNVIEEDAIAVAECVKNLDRLQRQCDGSAMLAFVYKDVKPEVRMQAEEDVNTLSEQIDVLHEELIFLVGKCVEHGGVVDVS